MLEQVKAVDLHPWYAILLEHMPRQRQSIQTRWSLCRWFQLCFQSTTPSVQRLTRDCINSCWSDSISQFALLWNWDVKRRAYLLPNESTPVDVEFAQEDDKDTRIWIPRIGPQDLKHMLHFTKWLFKQTNQILITVLSNLIKGCQTQHSQTLMPIILLPATSLPLQISEIWYKDFYLYYTLNASRAAPHLHFSTWICMVF